MNYFDVVNEKKQDLLISSRFAIVMGMATVWERSLPNGHQPQEPDFIAGLVLETVPLLSKAWRTILNQSRIDISVAGVFCHQTPKVHFSDMLNSSCELGDILFVHVHNDRSGNIFRNALLYQAKISSKQPYKIPSSEQDQLSLYYLWPSFEYVNSGKLNGKVRNVLPKMPHKGAQYLLIDDRVPSDPHSGYLGLPGTYPIGSCMASPTLHDHNMLEQELVDFLLLKSGRAFEDKVHTHDDWSLLVWDLLKTGFEKAFNRKKVGYSGAPRGWTDDPSFRDGLSFALTSSKKVTSVLGSLIGIEGSNLLFHSSENPPPNRENRDSQFFDENSGTSVVLIETRSSILE